MFLTKFIILCSLTALLNAQEAEVESNASGSDNQTIQTTSLPIVLQLTTQDSSPNDAIHTTSIEKRPPTESDENKHEADMQLNNEIEPNVEVFENKPGPLNAHQEEEDGDEANLVPEMPAEEEAATEGEDAVEEVPPAEPKEEAASELETAVPEEENAPEPASAVETEPADPEAVAETEPEPAVAAEPESIPEPEPVAEAESEEKPQSEVEPEPQTETETEPAAEADAATPDETPAEADTVGDPAGEPTQEHAHPVDEMQNDAPDMAAPESATPASVGTNSSNKFPKTCFSCNSQDEVFCNSNPTNKMNCKTGNPDNNEGHSGCYTIFKVDSNMTMRGCVDELAEQGLRECLTDDKFCTLCYTNDCNNKMPPNAAVSLQMNVYCLILLNSVAYSLAKYL
ncbi:protein TsetseEP [Stomoxys calcitrans]|uniref:protein TsetseEP n=1 Tax=Stomoxys calcitrans TaxID=35570 RepID=UPI0027E23DC3|nr:protein TsetseEP [Stomoxys calcitrans]